MGKYVLRPYQKAAADAALKAFQSKTKVNGLLVLPTGGGKSLIISEIAYKLGEPLLVFAPSKELVVQDYEKMCSYGVWDCGVYSASVGVKQINKITFATIGSVMNHLHDFDHFKYILVDEAHSVNAKGGQYEEFIHAREDRQVIGLTATPYRLGKGLNGTSMLKFLTRTRPRIFEKMLYYCQISELLNKGYLADLKYYDLTSIDLSRVRSNSTGADYDDNSLIREYERSGFYDKLTTTTLRVLRPKDGSQRNGVLVFTKFTKEAEELCEKLRYKGVNAECVSAQTKKDERDRIVTEFREGKIKVVANVGVLTTGFDMAMLDTIILGRPTKSLALYYQMCLDMQTEVLTRRGFMHYSEIKKTDEVAAYDNGRIIFTPIRSIVHRKTFDGEEFIGFNNAHIDFRVTGGHELLVKARGAQSGYVKEMAEKTILRKGLIEVPVSGVEEAKGLPLTDDDIRFLGWCISDGSVNKDNKSIHIVQSKAKPQNLIEIERVIRSCGLRYSKTLAKRKGDFAKYQDTYHFIISNGMPRRKLDKLRGLMGWCKYEKYINGCKQWCDEYEKMSEHQFDVFIDTINRADGSNRHTLDYNEQSISISCGTFRDYANKLQSLAIRRGYRCKLYEYIAANGNTQYLLHLKKIQHSTIAGCNVNDGTIQGKKPYQRSRLRSEFAKDEEVWCVKDDYGTIITRRNGKVLIMGNCGRAIRPYPNKNGWIIDLGGSYKQFGRVQDLKIGLEKANSQRWAVFSNGRQLTQVMY